MSIHKVRLEIRPELEGEVTFPVEGKVGHGYPDLKYTFTYECVAVLTNNVNNFNMREVPEIYFSVFQPKI